MLSPAFTACPTVAAIFRTFPGTEAATLTEPAPAAAFGAAFGAGAALGAAFGAAAFCCAGGIILVFYNEKKINKIIRIQNQK